MTARTSAWKRLLATASLLATLAAGCACPHACHSRCGAARCGPFFGPACFGFHSTCWQGWPLECPPCPTYLPLPPLPEKEPLPTPAPELAPDTLPPSAPIPSAPVPSAPVPGAPLPGATLPSAPALPAPPPVPESPPAAGPAAALDAAPLAPAQLRPVEDPMPRSGTRRP